jgi:formylaminopyrimidine deformylase / aminopyrimidine aminohydrolase
MNTAALIERFADEWRAATRHAFLDGVRDGTLPDAVFSAWLVQDYLFVNDVLVFQRRLATRTQLAVVAGGVVALEDELRWFEHHAGERGLHLDAARTPTAEAYRVLLEALETSAEPVAIVGLWAIERAYYDAWRSAIGGAPRYREFVDHWSVPEFGVYVDGLARAGDEALSAATPDEQAEAVATFLLVAQLEAEFWQMTWSGGG